MGRECPVPEGDVRNVLAETATGWAVADGSP